MKSLKPVLSRVSQIAQRAQTAATELSPAALVAILQQGRQNARLGIRPKLQTDEELRAGVRTRAGAVLVERLIAGRRRYEEYLRTHGPEARSSAGASPENSRRRRVDRALIDGVRRSADVARLITAPAWPISTTVVAVRCARARKRITTRAKQVRAMMRGIRAFLKEQEQTIAGIRG